MLCNFGHSRNVSDDNLRTLDIANSASVTRGTRGRRTRVVQWQDASCIPGNSLNVELASLEMDSLARMEFCIAIELSTGVSLLQAQLEKLASTDAVQQFLVERLHNPTSASA